MGQFELVIGDNDLSVTVTPVRGIFVIGLTNQTPIALPDVQLVWFPPVGGEILTRISPFSLPPMGEVTVLVGYSCPVVGSWRLLVLFQSRDGTDSPLVIAHSFMVGDSVPGEWRSQATWEELIPHLAQIELPLPPGTVPALALYIIGREIAAGLVPLQGDEGYLVSLNPVALLKFSPPGKVVISAAKGFVVPDPAFLEGRLRTAGTVDHHQTYYSLGICVSQLRLFLDLNWYVDEVVNVINKIHDSLTALQAPALLDPLISMLSERQTLKELTAAERALFEKTIQKLETVICPVK